MGPTFSGAAVKVDRNCPAGHRLLVQSIDYDTEDKFRAWLAETFGQEKAAATMIVRGFRASKFMSPEHHGSINRGFRAYLPIGFKETNDE